MIFLFAFILLIDILAALYFYREGFVVQSNKSKQYRQRLALVLALVVAALLLYRYSPALACLAAGVPALLAGGFALFMAMAVWLHKGPWR